MGAEMNEREALKLALDALYCSDDFLFDSHDCEPNNERELRRYEHARTQNIKAIEAIRKVFAQPEQESDDLTIAYMSGLHDGKNKYAPQRQPLTDEQIEKIIAANLETWNSKSAMASFVRAIEAAHGIKE